MKRFLAIVLTIVLSLAFAAPVAADAPGGPPVSVTGPIDFFEVIGGIPISIVGVGSFTAHIVKLDTSGENPAIEESWFRVAQFTGVISVFGLPPIPYEIADVRITVHAGTQPSQPIFTVRSSEPFLLPLPPPFGPGPFTMVQMVGGEIIFAK